MTHQRQSFIGLTLLFLLLSTIAVTANAETIFNADFESGTQGFAYLDDAFRGTSNPNNASGLRVASGGFSGAGLGVAIGGENGTVANGMSGAWTRSFSLSQADTVTVSFRYRHFFNIYFDPGECAQVLVAIDGNLHGQSGEDYVQQFCGVAYTGQPDQDTGWLEHTFQLALGAGNHTISLGGYLNQKTSSKELTQIYFDEVSVSDQSTTPPPPPPSNETQCADGLDEDLDGKTDCADSDCNGVGICEFGSELTCNDSQDNDADGASDCADSDCASATNCSSGGGEDLSYDFESGTQGFSYLDDAFRGTNHPSYAKGSRVSSGGFSGAGLKVSVGGVNGTDISNGMSGAWTKSFSVPVAQTIGITLRYRQIFTYKFEPEECGQVLVAVDGALQGQGSADYVQQFCGLPYTGQPSQDTGWLEFSFQIPLTAGNHTIAFGGYLNQKTTSSETIELFFDDLEIAFEGGSGPPPPPPPPPPPTPEAICDDGLDNDADGAVDCADSDCAEAPNCNTGGEPDMSYDFESGAQGFSYVDDTFRGTNQPNYATGNRVSSGGFSGAGLRVALGGVNGTDISNGMSGAWTKSFSVPEAQTVGISFRFRQIFTYKFEPEECSQVLAAVDGELEGLGSADYLHQFCGVPYTGQPSQDTGWLEHSFQIQLSAGNHTIALGGHLNQKTTSAEVAEVFFDNVEITFEGSTPPPPPSLLPVSEAFNNSDTSNWIFVSDVSTSPNWLVTSGRLQQENAVGKFSEDYAIGAYAYYSPGTSLDNYRVSVRIRPLVNSSSNSSSDAVGLMFRYIDGNNYYRFIMSRKQGYSRLEKVVGGVRNTLAFDGRGFVFGQWSNVVVDVSGSKIFILPRWRPFVFS